MAAADGRKPSALERVAVHAGAVAMVAFALYPLFWVFDLALSPGASGGGKAVPIPSSLSLEHFATLFGSSTSAPGSDGSLRTRSSSQWRRPPRRRRGDAGGLAWARRVRGEEPSTLPLADVPGVASAVPLYLLLDALGLLDSRTGLVLVYAATAVPFAVFQLRGAFLAIPRDLEEAALVDGATQLQAFLKVALPAARPAIAVTALFAFMSAWNEFILAATLLGRESAFTLPVVLQSYVGEHDADWGAFAAGAIVVSIPVMVVFYVAQRQLVSGLTSGGVKG